MYDLDEGMGEGVDLENGLLMEEGVGRSWMGTPASSQTAESGVPG